MEKEKRMLTFDEEKKLIEAAEAIKEFCNKKVCRSCYSKNCMFLVGSDCVFGKAPHNWELPKPRRFTDEDVALAKVLKAIGGTALDKDSYSWFCRGLTVRDGTGTFYLPDGVFEDKGNSYLVIPLDDIIAEEDNHSGTKKQKDV